MRGSPLRVLFYGTPTFNSIKFCCIFKKGFSKILGLWGFIGPIFLKKICQNFEIFSKFFKKFNILSFKMVWHRKILKNFAPIAIKFHSGDFWKFWKFWILFENFNSSPPKILFIGFSRNKFSIGVLFYWSKIRFLMSGPPRGSILP